MAFFIGCFPFIFLILTTLATIKCNRFEPINPTKDNSEKGIPISFFDLTSYRDFMRKQREN